MKEKEKKEEDKKKKEVEKKKSKKSEAIDGALPQKNSRSKHMMKDKDTMNFKTNNNNNNNELYASSKLISPIYIIYIIG